MSWNYRVRKTVSTTAAGRFEYFDIVEAYYNEDGILDATTKDGARPGGDTPEELLDDLYAMREAFKKPTLNPEDIPTL